SPDGSWLACVTAAPAASRTQIWLVRPDGTQPHLAAGEGTRNAVLGAGARHGWSADGCLLVTETDGLASAALLVEPGTGTRPLVAADVEGGSPHRVLAERADGELQDVVLAPDGSIAVLLWNADGGRSRVSLLDLVTGRQDQLSGLPRAVVDECRLSPKGDALLL